MKELEVKKRNVRWQYLRFLIKFGLWGVLAIVGISLAVAAGRFEEAFGPDALPLAPYPQMSFILLILTFILIALWYFAVDRELQMLHLYGDELIPPIPNIKLQVFMFVLLLGILAYFSNNPTLYSAIFVSFKLIEIWLLWIRDHKLREALDAARNNFSSDDVRSSALKVIEQYYLKRPQIPLAVTVLCFAFLALVFSVYGQFGDNERIGFSVAYSLLIAGICVNEILYQLWRSVRNKKLGETFS